MCHSRGACLFQRNDQNTTSVGANHASVMSTCKLVNPLTKEECVLKQSSRRVSPQPVGGVGRAPEAQCHRRDDQAVVRASENVTVSSPTCRRPGQKKRPPEFVSSSV